LSTSCFGVIITSLRQFIRIGTATSILHGWSGYDMVHAGGTTL
jgi:hypothetical protein